MNRRESRLFKKLDHRVDLSPLSQEIPEPTLQELADCVNLTLLSQEIPEPTLQLPLRSPFGIRYPLPIPPELSPEDQAAIRQQAIELKAKITLLRQHPINISICTEVRGDREITSAHLLERVHEAVEHEVNRFHLGLDSEGELRELFREFEPERQGLRNFHSSLITGDSTCAFNARSPHLRCAVNPSGPCENCAHYEPTSQD